jgi:hypothetical protein
LTESPNHSLDLSIDSEESESIDVQLDLGAFVRKLFPPDVFHDLKDATGPQTLRIPEGVRTGLPFVWDCELVLDLVSEITGNRDLEDVTYEECFDEVMEYLEDAPRPSAAQLILSLQEQADVRANAFRYRFCNEIADFIVERSLMFVLDIPV